MSSLGNKKIMAENIRHYMDKVGVSQSELCNTLGIKQPTFSDWVHAKTYPRIDKIELLANYFGISKADLVEERTLFSDIIPVDLGRTVQIPVFGKIPAGVPIEAIEDIEGYIDIPAEWTVGNEYFALNIVGDSMFPKYQEGDYVVVKVQADCESGQDCVVYVNGYDATLKRVVKKADCIILQPLNPAYEPRVYYFDEESEKIVIAGVVVELRRKI